MVRLTFLETCPTTQPYFITATAKGPWELVSSVVSLSVSSNVRRPRVAGAFANNLTSHFLRLPTTCKLEMAENQVQKNMLSLGDRVKLINYAKQNPGVGTRRITYVYVYYIMYK